MATLKPDMALIVFKCFPPLSSTSTLSSCSPSCHSPNGLDQKTHSFFSLPRLNLTSRLNLQLHSFSLIAVHCRPFSVVAALPLILSLSCVSVFPSQSTVANWPLFLLFFFHLTVSLFSHRVAARSTSHCRLPVIAFLCNVFTTGLTVCSQSMRRIMQLS